MKRAIPASLRHSFRTLSAVRRIRLALANRYHGRQGKLAVWESEAPDEIEGQHWATVWRDLQRHVFPLAEEQGIHRAIDVGCAQGWLVRRLAEVMDYVYGYDISPRRIQLAQRVAGGHNVTLSAADLSRSYPPLAKAKYLVTSMYVLSHNSPAAAKRMLGWIEAVCQPGSVCFLSEPWKIGRSLQLSVGDYYHGLDEVWDRALRNWDLTFFGDLTTPFETNRQYFQGNPRTDTRGQRVGKGILGLKVR